uniref:Uncharacterized protein n=1 Tax=Arundo donax TaxID=35708 RepID=A0A0A9EJP2_ARUDO
MSKETNKDSRNAFPVLQISLIPNLLRFLCIATLFPRSQVT